MSGYILDKGATVQCLHAGQAQPVSTNPRVKVGGQAVVTQDSLYTISGCSLPPPPYNTSMMSRSLLKNSSGFVMRLVVQAGLCICSETALTRQT